MIQISYPLAYKHFDEDMLKLAVETWHTFLSELDVRLVFNITGKIIATDKKGFPPTIAQILEEYQKAINPLAFVRPEEAWESVRTAIRKFGSYRESEALASLSNSTCKAVKSIGWMNLCMADDKQFDFMRKNFIEAYQNVENEDRYELLHPQAQKRLMEVVENIKVPNRFLEIDTDDVS